MVTINGFPAFREARMSGLSEPSEFMVAVPEVMVRAGNPPIVMPDQPQPEDAKFRELLVVRVPDTTVFSNDAGRSNSNERVGSKDPVVKEALCSKEGYPGGQKL
jgi:hypothetical protein